MCVRRHASLDYEQGLHSLAQLPEEAIVPVRSTMPRTHSIHRGAVRTFALAIGTLVAGVLVGAPGAHAGVVTAAKKTRKTVAKVVIPKPGTLCPTRAATFPGTSLDCVDVPARGLQWQYRGTLLNPFRLGEPAEVWSIEGSRFRMTLTDWNPAVTVPPGDYANELTARNSVLSAYRYRVTLLQSGAGARNLAADAATTAQYAVTANSKSPLRGSQPALPACNGSFDSFPPQPDVKVAREALQVGESGVEASCEEAPVGSNVVIENFDKDAANKLIVYTYFTGTPR